MSTKTFVSYGVLLCLMFAYFNYRGVILLGSQGWVATRGRGTGGFHAK